MDIKKKIKMEIEETQDILTNMLLQDVINKTRNNEDTLKLSKKLDKLILDFMET